MERKGGIGALVRRSAPALVVICLALSAGAAEPDAGEVLDAGLEVVPPVLVQSSPAAWPDDAGVSAGDVELWLTIDTAGEVADVRVEASPAEALTAAAVEAAKGLRFEPALQSGLPVAVVLAYRYRFVAPEPPAPDAGVPFVTLQGQIFTRGTREPIPLAQVTTADAQHRTETDAEGRFTLQVPPGASQVVVTASGHRRRVFKERGLPGQQVTVVYRLDRQYSRPYETVVRGQVDRAEVSRVSLSGAELHEVAGTAGEPLRVIMLLPGVVTPASGLSYPVVRGSLPAATGFFLDGVRVPQLFHLLAGSSVVHPDFIERLDFYPANPPTRFGRVSGGVVSADVARARDDRVHVTVQPTILDTSAFVEVPIAQTGTNVTLGGHVNYTAWLLGLLSTAGAFGPGVKPLFESYDYQARVEQKLGRGNVRLLAFGSSDRVGVIQPDEQPSVFTTSRFHRVDLRGQVPLGPGTLEVGSWLGFEEMGLEAEQQGQRVGAFLFDRFIWAGRATYRVPFGEHFQLKAGFDFERQASNVENSAAIGSGDLLKQPSVLGVFTGTFLEGALFAGPVTVVAGARVDTWHLVPGFTLASVDPRLDVRWQALPSLELHASAGLAHQAPMLLISLPVTDAGALKGGLQEVGQLSLGAQSTLPWFNLQLSGNVFYNHLFQARERSLVEFISGISSVDDRFNGNRWGRAYGLELMLRLPQEGRFFGWVSYTFMRSERQRQFAVFNEDQSTATVQSALLPFAFDQTHTLNVVAGLQLPAGVKVSASFHFNTGRPETGEFSSRTMRVVTNPTTGQPNWAPVPLSEVDRLPPFARLDLRVSKSIPFQSFGAELFLDVFNVLIRSEVYGYTYGYNAVGTPTKVSNGAPIILPTLGFKVVY